MSGRPTADIEADLRRHTCIVTEPDGLYAWTKIDLPVEAADRLAELDTKVQFQEMALRGWARHDALRPPCPTCGGNGLKIVPNHHRTREPIEDCPDCVDGKVSIEQLAATWLAVWESFWDDDQAAVRLPHNELTGTAKHLLAYLRAVKP